MKRALVVLSCAASLLAGCARQTPEPPAPVGIQQAWVQAVAGPAWAVRVITAEPSCPSLNGPGGTLATVERAAPGEFPPPLGNVQPESKPNRFTLRACEAAWPAGAESVRVGPFTLRAPAAEPRRIVVIGDTGCRMKASDLAFQSCNDADDWPMAAVMASALAQQPDLVIHVGDLHYRESACPAGRTGCAGSPWGYGDDAWQADFFRPATALLAAAPWVFVRGNHEACDRGGQGWQRYLDGYAPSAARSCMQAGHEANPGDFTEPFTVPLSPRSQLVVFDSSIAGSRPLAPSSETYRQYRAQLETVRQLVRQRPQNLFVNHHPTLAYGDVLMGKPVASRSGLTNVLRDSFGARYYPPEIQTVVHGHIHLYEALAFATDHPSAFVIGNGASAMYGHVDTEAALQIEPAPGAQTQLLRSHDQFGYSLLTREAGAGPDRWTLDSLDRHGKSLGRCRLDGQALSCQP